MIEESAETEIGDQ